MIPAKPASDGVRTDEQVQHRFPPHPLREYAMLADGHRGAVSGPRGEIVWMCAPQWHDDAVFAALLGGPGVYAVRPVEPFVWGGSYEPRSLIWNNRWVTTSTVVRCREALAYPGDPGRLVLLRRVEANEQDVELDVELDVRAGFGRPMRELGQDDEGRWGAGSGSLHLRWSGADQAVPDRDGVLRTRITVPAGEHHDLVLEISSDPLPEPVNPDSAWRSTEIAWAEAVPELPWTIAPRDAEHAYAVLRGMTVPGGGMVAAATMSLPERAEQGRNYDYRYAWIRDQCYAGIAVAAVGPHALLDDAVSFMTARLLEEGDRLRPAYTVNGAEIPDEQELNLPGYPGAQTVRRGNWVTRQFQLDSFGEILQLLAAAAHHDRLNTDGTRAIEIAVAAIDKHWQRPEAGMWEVDDDWWTHSRLACVAGLRAVARDLPSCSTASDVDPDALLALADTILAETSRRCLHSEGYWQRSPRATGTDAALLLPAVRGALRGDDPRTLKTLEAVHRDLTDDGYVYRFAPSTRPLGEDEGAFLLCGFLVALAEHQQGNETTALRWFERTRASCGPAALLSEEYDVLQRQLRGNLPQAFVHALLLESSCRLHK